MMPSPRRPPSSLEAYHLPSTAAHLPSPNQPAGSSPLFAAQHRLQAPLPSPLPLPSMRSPAYAASRSSGGPAWTQHSPGPGPGPRFGFEQRPGRPVMDPYHHNKAGRPIPRRHSGDAAALLDDDAREPSAFSDSVPDSPEEIDELASPPPPPPPPSSSAAALPAPSPPPLPRSVGAPGKVKRKRKRVDEGEEGVEGLGGVEGPGKRVAVGGPVPATHEKGRKGAPKACESCRKSKLRCDDIQDGKCRKCRRSGHECVFPQPKRNSLRPNFSPHQHLAGPSTSKHPAGAPSYPSALPVRARPDAGADAEGFALDRAHAHLEHMQNRLATLDSYVPAREQYAIKDRLRAVEADLTEIYYRTGRDERWRMQGTRARRMPPAVLAAPPVPPPPERAGAEGAEGEGTDHYRVIDTPTGPIRTAYRPWADSWVTRGRNRTSVAALCRPAEPIAPPLSPFHEPDEIKDGIPPPPLFNDPRPDPLPLVDDPNRGARFLGPASVIRRTPEEPMEVDDGVDGVGEEGGESWDWRVRDPLPSPSRPLSENDVIGRGVVAKAEAEKWWRQFLDVFKNRIPWGETPNAPLDEVRDRSDILVSVAVGYMAAHDGRLPRIAANAFQDARHITRELGLSPTRHATLADVRGALAVLLVMGFANMRTFARRIALELGLHQVFVKLTVPKYRGSPPEADLIEKGRLWVLFQMYDHILSFCSQEAVIFAPKAEVLGRQIACLRKSEHALPEADHHLQAHIGLVRILSEASAELRRRVTPDYSEQDEARVQAFLDRVDRWRAGWSENLPDLTDDKRTGYRELEEPSQYATLLILFWALQPFSDGDLLSYSQAAKGWGLRAAALTVRLLETAVDNAEEPSPLSFAVDWHKMTFGVATGLLMSLLLLIPGYLPPRDLARGRRVIFELAKRHGDPKRRLPEYDGSFRVFFDGLEGRERAWREAGWRPPTEAAQGEGVSSAAAAAESSAPWRLMAFALTTGERDAIQEISKDPRLWFMCFEPEYY